MNDDNREYYCKSFDITQREYDAMLEAGFIFCKGKEDKIKVVFNNYGLTYTWHNVTKQLINLIKLLR